MKLQSGARNHQAQTANQARFRTLGQLKYKVQIGIHSTTNPVSHKGDLSTSSIIFY